MQGFPDELRAAYTPLESLGSGAMGAVFRAREEALDREVAVKVGLAPSDRKLLERFQREAESLARVEHPNLLRLYSHGVTEAGETYLITEFLDGSSLEGAGRIEDALEVMLPIADALEAVHQAGLVHRDVKPANIVRTRDGRSVLVDFGLVRAPERTALTRTGQVVGTFLYMAPERLRGEGATPAGDWFAWGVSLFELVHGERPYSSEAFYAAMNGVDLPETLRRDEGELGRLLARCLAGEPGLRPRNRGEIDEILQGSGPARSQAVLRVEAPGRRVPLAPGLLGLALLGLGVGLLAFRGVASEETEPPELRTSSTSDQPTAPAIRAYMDGFEDLSRHEGQMLWSLRAVLDPRCTLQLRRILRETEDLVRSGGPSGPGRIPWLRSTIDQVSELASALILAKWLSEDPLMAMERLGDDRPDSGEVLVVQRRWEEIRRVFRKFLEDSDTEAWGGSFFHGMLACAVGERIKLLKFEEYLAPMLAALDEVEDPRDLIEVESRLLATFNHGGSRNVLTCGRIMDILLRLEEAVSLRTGDLASGQLAHRRAAQLSVRYKVFLRCKESAAGEAYRRTVLVSLEHLRENFDELSGKARLDARHTLGELEKFLGEQPRLFEIEKQMQELGRELRRRLAARE